MQPSSICGGPARQRPAQGGGGGAAARQRAPRAWRTSPLASSSEYSTLRGHARALSGVQAVPKRRGRAGGPHIVPGARRLSRVCVGDSGDVVPRQRGRAGGPGGLNRSPSPAVRGPAAPANPLRLHETLHGSRAGRAHTLPRAPRHHPRSPAPADRLPSRPPPSLPSEPPPTRARPLKALQRTADRSHAVSSRDRQTATAAPLPARAIARCHTPAAPASPAAGPGRSTPAAAWPRTTPPSRSLWTSSGSALTSASTSSCAASASSGAACT